jgi:uncharacterized protein with PIN domain
MARKLFVCDAMLGGLARWLRAAGHDASWHHGIEDRELVRLAAEQGRTLLTSDTKIFEFAVIRDRLQPALFVPVDLQPREQLAFVLDKLRLPLLEPRCMACGGELVARTRQEVAGRVPSRNYAWLDRFWECERCRKVFWHGTHWDKIEKVLAVAVANRG